MRDRAIDLLKELAEAHGVPGHEEAIRRIWKREMADFSPASDRFGNVFAETGGTDDSPRVVVAGHMDEVGFIVQMVTSDGFLRFRPVGGWAPQTLPAQRVRILTRSGDMVEGVIASTPPHLMKKDARARVPEIDELYIDVGASSAGEVSGDFGIRLGDPIAPSSTFTQMSNQNRILCKAFDNRVGMALTIQSLQKLRGSSHPNLLMGVGTAQEEMGMRGAKVAGETARPDVALIMEGPPADDRPGGSPSEFQGRLGGGVQIRVFDPSAIMNKALVEFSVGVADEMSIPHQIAVRRSGGTDAAAFQYAGVGCPVVVLGVPARYIHTHNAMIDIRDYCSAMDLVRALVERLDASTVAGFTDFLGG
jgi:endoglucanase